jgi:hypothetical protein
LVVVMLVVVTLVEVMFVGGGCGDDVSGNDFC